MTKSDWESGSVAHVAGVSLRQADVALLSPGCSPTVLYGPSLFARSNEENCVVDVKSAVREDSTCVGVPVCGIDAHCQRSTND